MEEARERARERREPDGNYDMISIIGWQPFLSTSHVTAHMPVSYCNHNRREK